MNNPTSLEELAGQKQVVPFGSDQMSDAPGTVEGYSPKRRGDSSWTGNEDNAD